MRSGCDMAAAILHSLRDPRAELPGDLGDADRRAARARQRDLRDLEAARPGAAPGLEGGVDVEREAVHADAARDVDAAGRQLLAAEPDPGRIAPPRRARGAERGAGLGDRRGDLLE